MYSIPVEGRTCYITWDDVGDIYSDVGGVALALPRRTRFYVAAWDWEGESFFGELDSDNYAYWLYEAGEGEFAVPTVVIISASISHPVKYRMVGGGSPFGAATVYALDTGDPETAANAGYYVELPSSLRLLPAGLVTQVRVTEEGYAVVTFDMVIASVVDFTQFTVMGFAATSLVSYSGNEMVLAFDTPVVSGDNWSLDGPGAVEFVGGSLSDGYLIGTVG